MQHENNAIPHPLIAEYVAYLSKPGIPYVSNGPSMLFRLHREHGYAYINSLLDKYWNDLRVSKQKDRSVNNGNSDR